MAYIYRYNLKKKRIREKVDLKIHTVNITKALVDQFGDNLMSKVVLNAIFEFRLYKPAKNYELRMLGRKILENDETLRSIKVKNEIFGTSFFQRMKNEYYGLIEDVRYMDDECNIRFEMIDVCDFENIKNQVIDERFNRIEWLSKLDTFTLAVKIKQKDIIRNLTDRNEDEIKGNWYKISGMHRRSTEKGLVYLDFEQFYHLNMKTIKNNEGDAQEYKDGYELSSISEVDRILIEKLNHAIHIERTYFDDDKIELIKSKNDLKFIVYNVGQGLCSAVCDSNRNPLTFIDFGGGERKDSVTYPSTVSFSFVNNPSIVLTHVHTDHWVSVNRFKEALDLKWYIPDQFLKVQISKLCAKLQLRGNLVFLDKTKKFELGEIFKGTGNKKHYHNDGFGVILEIDVIEANNKVRKRILVPGDTRYEYIDLEYKKDLDVLVATHHGGEYFARSTKKNIHIPQNSKKGTVVYSYGKHKKFGKRNNSHGHPSYKQDYRGAKWIKEHDTPKGDFEI